MHTFTFFIRWSCLLGVALMAPIDLPAGGSLARGKMKICRGSETLGPLIAGTSCHLKPSPIISAPTLRAVDLGTPLRPLRTWETSNGEFWIHVQIASLNLSHSGGSNNRGWVKTSI